MTDRDDAGRDPETGRFTTGNRFWEARSSAGPKPKFDGPEPLWSACQEYFVWVDEHPLHEAKAFSYEGKVTVAARFTVPACRSASSACCRAREWWSRSR